MGVGRDEAEGKGMVVGGCVGPVAEIRGPLCLPVRLRGRAGKGGLPLGTQAFSGCPRTALWVMAGSHSAHGQDELVLNAAPTPRVSPTEDRCSDCVCRRPSVPPTGARSAACLATRMQGMQSPPSAD